MGDLDGFEIGLGDLEACLLLLVEVCRRDMQASLSCGPMSSLTRPAACSRRGRSKWP